MPTSLEVVIPVLDEESDLAPNTLKLHEFLASDLGNYDWRITIADNGSTDATPEIAKRLSDEHERISHLRLEERGRGRAVSTAWLNSDADILGLDKPGYVNLPGLFVHKYFYALGVVHRGVGHT